MLDWSFNSEDVSQFMLENSFIKSAKNFPTFENKKALTVMVGKNGNIAKMWKIEPCRFWQTTRDLSTGEETLIDDWTFSWMEFLTVKHEKEYLAYLKDYTPVLQEEYREYQRRIMSTKTETELRNLPECVLIKKIESCPNIGSTNDEDEKFEDFAGHQQRFDTKIYRYMEMIWNKIQYLEQIFSQEQDMNQEM